MLRDVRNLLATSTIVVSTLYLEGKMTGGSGDLPLGIVIAILSAAFVPIQVTQWILERKERRKERLSGMRNEILQTIHYAIRALIPKPDIDAVAFHAQSLY